MARSVTQKPARGYLPAKITRLIARLGTIRRGSPVVGKDFGASTDCTRQEEGSAQSADTLQAMAISVRQLRATILTRQSPAKPKEGLMLVRSRWQ